MVTSRFGRSSSVTGMPETEPSARIADGGGAESASPGDPILDPADASGQPPAPTEREPPNAAEEVTLGFALSIDAAGNARSLSDPLTLATILCAVDAERSRRTFVWSHPEEVVEAVAPVYWPLLVVRSPLPGRAVIFDGTGLWKQSLARSRMPPIAHLSEALAQPPATPELARWLQGLRTPLLYEPIADSITIEGLVPAELPLLSEILNQSAFRSEPISAHAGFLPPRHPLGWYESTVGDIARSLEHFDAELAQLSAARGAVDAFCRATNGRLEEERRQLHFELSNRSRFYAHAEMDREAETVGRTMREQIFGELERIRAADSAIADARASARVAEVLVERGSARGLDVGAHRNRVRAASETERAAGLEIQRARARIATFHERERDAYHVLTDRVALVERRAAEELSAHELMREEILTSGADLVAALESHAHRRAREREQLAAHFTSLPALAGVHTLWLPLWVASLTSPSHARCVVFPPMRVRTGIGVGDSIKTLFGGMVLPLEPRTAEFGRGLRATLEAAIESDPWLSGVTREIVRAADVTAGPEFLPHLALGLQQLREAGWINVDQERRYFDACSAHLRTRPIGAPPGSMGPARPGG